MPPGSYRFFDHTGDYGLEVQAEGREELLRLTALAFLELLCGATGGVRALEARPLEVEGLDPADLLVAFANELLYGFDAEGFLWARFEPTRVEEERIEGTLWGEAFDPERHDIARPVKAVTHHQACFDPQRARLIFDL